MLYIGSGPLGPRTNGTVTEAKSMAPTDYYITDYHVANVVRVYIESDTFGDTAR